MMKVRLTLLAFAFFALTACSGAPSDDVLEWAIGQKHSSIQMGVVKMKDYEIDNSYTREIEGESVFFYDYAANTSMGIVRGSFSVVKRGEKWYMY